MSSPPFQDRRFMWQTGKHVHEPTRKSSMGEQGGADAPKKASIASPGGLSTLTNMGGDNAPASKFLYMSGKHVHEPGRKGSVGSDKAGAGSPTSTTSSAAGRRKVWTTSTHESVDFYTLTSPMGTIGCCSSIFVPPKACSSSRVADINTVLCVVPRRRNGQHIESIEEDLVPYNTYRRQHM